ncbi:MAG: glutathione S-transferase N-terminal domain-containing protein, partial [Pseudomonadota bacterium]|nr:glutathione S-transferase N-terminal domain-containing protein [Pseudomonadota bacterium]
MRLFMNKTSPYSRKVRVAVIELNLSEQVEEVITDPFAAPSELLAANPISKIPTLITDRGEALPDSSLILEYLQTRA